MSNNHQKIIKVVKYFVILLISITVIQGCSFKTSNNEVEKYNNSTMIEKAIVKEADNMWGKCFNVESNQITVGSIARDFQIPEQFSIDEIKSIYNIINNSYPYETNCQLDLTIWDYSEGYIVGGFYITDIGPGYAYVAYKDRYGNWHVPFKGQQEPTCDELDYLDFPKTANVKCVEGFDPFNSRQIKRPEDK